MKYTFITDSKNEAHFDKIALKMVDLFKIDHEEAVGRINRHWSGETVTGSDNMLDHEVLDYWANTVFYGWGSFWWMNPPDLKPLPYP